MSAGVSIAALFAAFLTALAATAAPLVVYAGTLACFGLAHVASELAYVRDRFGVRLPRTAWLAWGALLLATAALRALGVLRVALPFDRLFAELLLLALLLLAAALFVARERRGAGLLVAAIATMLLLWLPPAATVALLAFAHNLTPIGFLAERFDGRERRRVLLACAIGFVALPALIAAGGFDALLRLLPWASSDGAFLRIGAPIAHYGAFLPFEWHERDFAPRLFAAAVYLQCAHYFVVLHLLPKLAAPLSVAGGSRVASNGGSGRPRAGRGWARALIGVAAALLLVAFFRSFADARALYGVVAVLHAWVEWPLFLAVAGGGARPVASAS